MKKALAGVLVAACVGLWAVGAMAQAPFIQVYFDDGSNGSYGETQSDCGQPSQVAFLYLVAQNVNSWVSAVEYQVSFPGALMFAADQYPPTQGGTLNIGNSQDGNAVGYELPRSGYEPMLISQMVTVWTGECDCRPGYGSPFALVVKPYPYIQNPTTHPILVSWPEYTRIAAVGMTSLICPGPVSVEEKTWGGIKALYR